MDLLEVEIVWEKLTIASCGESMTRMGLRSALFPASLYEARRLSGPRHVRPSCRRQRELREAEGKRMSVGGGE
jgi:hypothetical protein